MRILQTEDLLSICSKPIRLALRTIDELAEACGVARRTLQKHFRRFAGQTVRQRQLELRLDQERRELLRAKPDASVSEIAARCCIGHLGRLGAIYRSRYGETPSATLRRRRQAIGSRRQVTILSPLLERPVIAIHRFELFGSLADGAGSIADEICAGLLRNRWLAVGSPMHARYHLRGNVRKDCLQRLRIMVMLSDGETGRHLWADRWDGDRDNIFAFEERVAANVAAAVGRSLCFAETKRVHDRDPAQLSAWELTMRALPHALLIDRVAQGEALETLERAMELSPQDPLPISLAAWCHAQRGSHHLVAQTAAEKLAGRKLALQGAGLRSCDPIAESLLAGAYALAGDLDTAAAHIERALALDSACAWAWNRSGMLNVYRGQFGDATECFQIARTIDPDHPLNFMCTIGIGSACFDAARYEQAARWFSGSPVAHPAQQRCRMARPPGPA